MGIHGMGLLAASHKRMSAHDMSKILGVSEAHLTKVFQRLVREGLTLSVRGPGGGFELKVPPEKITLLQIYQAIEGITKDESKFCSCCDNCSFSKCLFGNILKQSTTGILDYLSSTTLDKASLKFHEAPFVQE